MIFVYILKLNNKTHYTGITNSLYRRMRQHHNKQSKSTRNAICIELIHVEGFNTRIEARKQEVFIKNKGARKYLLNLYLKG